MPGFSRSTVPILEAEWIVQLTRPIRGFRVNQGLPLFRESMACGLFLRQPKSGWNLMDRCESRSAKLLTTSKCDSPSAESTVSGVFAGPVARKPSGVQLTVPSMIAIKEDGTPCCAADIREAHSWVVGDWERRSPEKVAPNSSCTLSITAFQCI
jgi:hypothetical protein